MNWVINIIFCLITAVNFTLYALAFRKVGPAEISFNYVFSVLTNPFFVLALVMALLGSILRMAVFTAFGVMRSAVVSEMTVVFTLVLAFLVFQEKLDLRFFVGTGFILIGVYLLS